MTLSTTAEWDQSKFDAALKAKLERLKTEKVPRAINKTGFFVALGGLKETPKKEPFAIEADVNKQVTVTNKKGYVRSVPILWVLAAKRVAKGYAEKKMLRGENSKRSVKAGKFYLQLLRKKASTILGSRKRAAGFFRVGFLSIVKRLGPYVKNRSGSGASYGGAKLMGELKGDAKPATAGYQPTCTLIHSAQARSDRANGQLRVVKPALDRAMAKEAKQIIEYLREETAPELNGKIT